MQFKIVPVLCGISSNQLIDNTPGIIVKKQQNYWIVEPEDKTIDAEYIFKILVIGNGG